MSALERLRRDEPVFGLFQTFPDAAVTEIAVWSGYDFVVVDSEHGVADEAAQIEVLRTVSGTGAFSIVRTRPQDESSVARYLDFGADGVMVPDVRTVRQAQEIAFAANDRWTGGLRVERYGLAPRGAVSPRPLVVLLIESPEGVANIEAIMDVDGVDAVIIGTGDLSVRLNAPGAFDTPAILSAVAAVERAVLARGKILGSKIDHTMPVSTALARGHRLLLIGRDVGLIKSALVDTLAAAKQDAGAASSQP